MTVPLKLLSRVAISIHAHLQQTKSNPSPPELPAAAWQDCRRQLALWEKSHHRQWPVASRSCRQRLLCAAQHLKRQTETLERELAEPPISLATAADIYADLVALAQEFPQVRVSLQDQEVAVTTEPIELEEICLGSFEIVLTWKSLPRAGYYVKAMEPHPAGGDSETTHPHIQSETLCEGEARPAINAALASGRMLDFFLVVNQTLTTYNPSSAYVSLDRWEGLACCDCGGYVPEDDLCPCERCECDLCSECSSCCEDCARYCCADCGTVCPGCSNFYCHSCLAACTCCDSIYCKGCLIDETCQPCINQAAAEKCAASKTKRAAACEANPHAPV